MADLKASWIIPWTALRLKRAALAGMDTVFLTTRDEGKAPGSVSFRIDRIEPSHFQQDEFSAGLLEFTVLVVGNTKDEIRSLELATQVWGWLHYPQGEVTEGDVLTYNNRHGTDLPLLGFLPVEVRGMRPAADDNKRNSWEIECVCQFAYRMTPEVLEYQNPLVNLTVNLNGEPLEVI